MTARDVMRGALAAAAATAPMTLFMELTHRALPRGERYPLPPRLITEQASARSGVELPRSEGHRVGLTLLAHFGYGAAAGAVYGLRPGRAVPRRASEAAADGALFGLAVWEVSYLGLLPAIRLLEPATEHPWRRNALMIAAHVVWGATTGAVARLLREQPSDRRQGRAR